MRKTSLTLATLTFFALAFVGWAHGAMPLDCALRALLGATVIYLLVRLAERVVTHIMIDALARSITHRGEWPEGGPAESETDREDADGEQ